MVLFPSWGAASVALSPPASPPPVADGAAWPASTEQQTVNSKKSHVQIVFSKWNDIIPLDSVLIRSLLQVPQRQWYISLLTLGCIMTCVFRGTWPNLNKKYIIQSSHNAAVLTRNRCEELDSISVAVEGELSLSHGAVRNKRPRCHFVPAVVAVHPYCAARLVALCLGRLVGRWRKE